MSSTPPPIPPDSQQPDPYGSPGGGQAAPPWQQYPQQQGYPPQQGYPQHQGYPQQYQGHPRYAGYPQQAPYPPQQGYAQPPYPYAQPAPEKHSTAGKLSVGLAILGGVLFAASFIAAAVLGQNMDPNSVEANIVGFGIMAAMGFNFVGILMALAAFMEKNKKRHLAWVGLTMNGVPCLCGLGLMGLGLVAVLAGVQP